MVFDHRTFAVKNDSQLVRDRFLQVYQARNLHLELCSHPKMANSMNISCKVSVSSPEVVTIQDYCVVSSW